MGPGTARLQMHRHVGRETTRRSGPTELTAREHRVFSLNAAGCGSDVHTHAKCLDKAIYPCGYQKGMFERLSAPGPWWWC